MQIVLKKKKKNSQKNNKLTQQRFRSEKRNAFTEEIKKIVL